jgi:PKD repeat protein
MAYLRAAVMLLAALSTVSLHAESLYFNFFGSDQYVQVPANPSLTPSQMTLEAWVAIAAGGGGTIASRGDGSTTNTDYIFQISNDGSSVGTEVSFFGAGYWDSSTSGIPTNTWTHVAVTYDGTNKLFYINGVLSGTSARPGPLHSTPGSPFYLGIQGSVCQCNLFKGLLSEVRLWNTVRTASQIQVDMNYSSGSHPGLVAYYHLDEGSGSTANDASGNGNTGTLENNPYWDVSGPPDASLVTNAADSGAGTLRSAITSATNGEVITFAPNLSGATITLASTLALNKSFTIDASALPGGIQISGNGAVQVFNVAATVSLNSLNIINGFDNSDGAGIFNDGTLTLNDCTLSGNMTANGNGGGILNDHTLTLNDCTLSGNSVNQGDGGGIYSKGSTITLNECTLVGNSVTNGSGGGIYNGGSTLTVMNSIVAGNGTNVDVYNGGTLAYGGSNLVQTVAGNAGTGPAPLTNAPDLASLRNCGGPTQTMPPLPGSPAIGAGSVAANAISTDQRGYPRTQNGRIDIGAVELPTVQPFTASPTNDLVSSAVQFDSTNMDSDGSAIVGWNWSFGNGNASTAQNPTEIYYTPGAFSPVLIVTDSLGLALGVSGPSILVNSFAVNSAADSGPGTLRSALTNALNEGLITFATNLSGATITLGSTLVINKSLTIDASALPGGIHINGNGNVQVFYVPSDVDAVLNSLSINSGNGNEGGGITNAGALTLNNCTLSGNRANSTYDGFDLIVGEGGGIYNDGILTLNECTLSGNVAAGITGIAGLGGDGGGIYNSGTLTLNQCTLDGNDGDSEGGGIFNQGTAELNNTIVAGNSGNSGADIYIQGNLTYGGANLVQSVYHNSGSISGPTPVNAAPDLATLSDYGGPTFTMPPLLGSPAIGAGSVAINIFATDQRGYPRTQNGLIDLGAVELPTASFTASPTNDWLSNPVLFNGPAVDSDGSAIVEWNWSFGDGNASTNQNPTDVYANTGVFSPGLIVTNSLGLTLAATGPAITVYPPLTLSSIGLSGTNLTLSGANGISGLTYTVLASTNLMLPLSQWTPLVTNTWSANGAFSLTLTNALNPPAPSQFYLLEVP